MDETSRIAFNLPVLDHPIYWFGVMFALAFIAAASHWNLTAKRLNWPKGIGSDIAMWIMIGGVVGARTAFVIANWREYKEAPLSIFRMDQGGAIFYGGLVGATLCCIIFAKVKKIPLLHMADFGLSGVPLGQALGRVGCFLNGCCHGKPSQSFWAVQRGNEHVLPTQLFESAGSLLLYGLLLYLYPRFKTHGRIASLYMMAYGCLRFVMEFTRGDPRLKHAGLTVAQELSMAIFIVGLALWILSPKLNEKYATS